MSTKKIVVAPYVADKDSESVEEGGKSRVSKTTSSGHQTMHPLLIAGIVLIVVAIVAVAIIVPCIYLIKPHHDDPRWADWKKRYSEHFDDDDEDDEHEANFLEALERIDEYERESDLVHEDIDFDVNEFSDHSLYELRLNLLGRRAVNDRDVELDDYYSDVEVIADPNYLRTPVSKSWLHLRSDSVITGPVSPTNSDDPNEYLPDSYQFPGTILDWRNYGALTQVKNQKDCGSCYAFAATNVFEGRLFVATGKRTNLSEQQIVDCSKPFGNNGCQGGDGTFVYRYIQSSKGLNTGSQYPYKNDDTGNCFSDSLTDVRLSISEFKKIPPRNTEAIMNALRSGPVNAAMKVIDEFYFYKRGVYQDAQCLKYSNPLQLDHAVSIVGYGTDPSNQLDYWIVRNSWGPSWGEGGYFRLRRGQNMCGIESDVDYPVVDAV